MQKYVFYVDIEEYDPETGLLSVYPNPASDFINCVMFDNEDYEIVIYDALSSIAYPSIRQ